jgi:hypothetical protein
MVRGAFDDDVRHRARKADQRWIEKEKKLALIEALNPTWRDLYEELA